MKRTRVKICGIARSEDAQVASELGADAVGLVFGSSPRQVALSYAVDIVRAVGPFVSRVGVFADQPLAFIREGVNAAALDIIQLSGSEPPDLAAAVDLPVIKAIHIGSREDLVRYRSYPADWFLLDAPSAGGRMGGTGTVFDWDLVDDLPWDRGRVVVAGGLKPQNVGDVIARVRPAAVDVSSGVEREPGIKDPAKIEAFIAAVAEADARLRSLEELRE